MSVYYIDPVAGDDGNAGIDASDAWATLAKANQTLVAGDTVIVLGDQILTAWNDYIMPVNSGTPGNPITYKCEDGHRTTLATNYYKSPTFYMNTETDMSGSSRNYISIKGFEIKSKYWGRLDSSNNIILDDLITSNYDDSDEYSGTYGFRMQHASYSKITNCYLNGSMSYGSQDLIFINGTAHHNIVEYNIISHASHTTSSTQGQTPDGIASNINSTNTTRFNVIRNNYFINNYHHTGGAGSVGSIFTLLEGNFHERSGEGTYAGTGSNASDNALGAVYGRSSYNIVRHNIIRQSGSADSVNMLGAYYAKSQNSYTTFCVTTHTFSTERKDISYYIRNNDTGVNSKTYTKGSTNLVSSTYAVYFMLNLDYGEKIEDSSGNEIETSAPLSLIINSGDDSGTHTITSFTYGLKYHDDVNQAVGSHLYNNVFYKNWGLAYSSGIGLDARSNPYHDVPQCKSNVLKNNIFYKNGENTVPFPGQPTHTPWLKETIISYGISMGDDRANTDDLWENNLLENTDNEKILIYGASDNDEARNDSRSYTLSELENGDLTAEFPLMTYQGNIQANPSFADPDSAYDENNLASIFSQFNLQAGSPCINGGAFLTTCNGSGTNSDIVTVHDSLYFAGGSNVNNWDSIIAGDTIQIGTHVVQIISIDYTTHQLTIDQSIDWADGDNVSLPYSGSSPDMGIKEYEALAPEVPTATTLNASNINQGDATINGSVNPNGLETTYHFEWGEDTNYGNTTTSKSAGSGASSVNVSELLEPLLDNTTYHCRIVATNSEGTSYGLDVSFLTLEKPVEEGLYKINLKRSLAVGPISFMLRFFYSNNEGTEDHILLDFDTFNVGNDDISDIIYYPGNFKMKLKVDGDIEKWKSVYDDLLNVTCVVDAFDGNSHIWSGYVDSEDVSGNSFTKTLEFTTLDQMKRLENYKPSDNPLGYPIYESPGGSLTSISFVNLIKDILTSDQFQFFPYVADVIYLGNLEARANYNGGEVIKSFETFYTVVAHYYKADKNTYENMLQLLKQTLLNFNCIGYMGFDKKFYLIPRVAEEPEVITIKRDMLNNYPHWERVLRMSGMLARLGTGSYSDTIYEEEIRGDVSSDNKRKVEDITIEIPGDIVEGGRLVMLSHDGGFIPASDITGFRTKDKDGNFTAWDSLWKIPVDNTWDLIKFDRQKVKVRIEGDYNSVPIWKYYKFENIDMIFRAAKAGYDFKKKEVTLSLRESNR